MSSKSRSYRENELCDGRRVVLLVDFVLSSCSRLEIIRTTIFVKHIYLGNSSERCQCFCTKFVRACRCDVKFKSCPPHFRDPSAVQQRFVNVGKSMRTATRASNQTTKVAKIKCKRCFFWLVCREGKAKERARRSERCVFGAGRKECPRPRVRTFISKSKMLLRRALHAVKETNVSRCRVEERRHCGLCYQDPSVCIPFAPRRPRILANTHVRTDVGVSIAYALV